MGSKGSDAKQPRAVRTRSPQRKRARVIGAEGAAWARALAERSPFCALRRRCALIPRGIARAVSRTRSRDSPGVQGRSPCLTTLRSNDTTLAGEGWYSEYTTFGDQKRLLGRRKSRRRRHETSPTRDPFSATTHTGTSTLHGCRDSFRGWAILDDGATNRANRSRPHVALQDRRGHATEVLGKRRAGVGLGSDFANNFWYGFHCV